MLINVKPFCFSAPDEAVSTGSVIIKPFVCKAEGLVQKVLYKNQPWLILLANRVGAKKTLLLICDLTFFSQTGIKLRMGLWHQRTGTNQTWFFPSCFNTSARPTSPSSDLGRCQPRSCHLQTHRFSQRAPCLPGTSISSPFGSRWDYQQC